jgi:2-(1,2-epoxy-1,2-dihydrophenyl)acetyl-CoA isomerase
MIGYETIGAGAVITLDRAERRNAMSPELVEALSDAVDRAVAEGARAILLTAAGTAFCAGGELGETLPDDAGAILEEAVNPLVLKLWQLPVPLIVAVNGPAIGAGCSLALAGDVILAGRSALFAPAFAAVGLVADAGASWLLPRTLGFHRAMAMVLLAESFGPDQAKEWGIVHKVVDDEALAGEARALLERLAAGPTRSYAMLRQALRAASESGFEQALAEERIAQRRAGETADFREGAAAFRERRRPLFTGQ